MDPAKKVHIQFTVNSQRFDIGIADEGAGFTLEDVPDPMAPENLERPCGRGLLLIRHYMTEVTFHAPGNRLSMCKVRAANGHGLNGNCLNGLMGQGHTVNGHTSNPSRGRSPNARAANGTATNGHAAKPQSRK